MITLTYASLASGMTLGRSPPALNVAAVAMVASTATGQGAGTLSRSIYTKNVNVNGKDYAVVFGGGEPRAVYRVGLNTKHRAGRRGSVGASRLLPMWGPAALAAIAKATGAARATEGGA